MQNHLKVDGTGRIVVLVEVVIEVAVEAWPLPMQNHLAQVDGTGRIVVLVEVVVEVAVEACGNQRDHTMEAVTARTGEPRITTVLDNVGSVIVSHQWSSRYTHKSNQSLRM